MRKYFRTIALVATTIFTSQAYGGCDACIQASATAANTAMTGSVNATSAAVQANTQATNVLNSSINLATTTLTQTVTFNTQQLMQSLDASTNRQELAIQANTKAQQNLSDHLIKTLVNALKEVEVSKQVDKNNKTYGSIAQPLSGEIGANRAGSLKQGYVQHAQIWEKMSQDMHAWNSNTDASDSGGKDRRTALLLAEPDEVWDPTPLLTKTTLTEDESLNMQRLLTMMVNPNPKNPVSEQKIASDPRAAKDEIERKLNNAKLEMVHAALSKSIAQRHPTVPIGSDTWQMGYVTSEGDANGLTSLESVYESETMGRLGSDGWFLDVKTKTEAGILREQVYLQAIRNQVLLDIVKQEEAKVQMLALIAIESTEK